VPTADGGSVEVRRAEPVRPMDGGNEPLLQAPTPPPIDFSDGDGHP
jgi:hypothetical protein